VSGVREAGAFGQHQAEQLARRHAAPIGDDDRLHPGQAEAAEIKDREQCEIDRSHDAAIIRAEHQRPSRCGF